MEQMNYNAGQTIFSEGDPSDCAYVVLSGRVEIFKKVQKGTVLLSELGQGEIFGEMGIISEKPRSAFAAAASPCTLKKIDRNTLIGLFRNQPQEVILIMQTLMERLRESSQKVSELMNHQAQFQVDTGKVAQPGAGAAPASSTVSRITITPANDAMKQMMGAEEQVVNSLPFRVGALPAGEESNPLDWNNLFIKDGDPNMMSRNHFSVQRGAEGLYVMDRGSKAGTIVNGESIGGKSGKYRINLKNGDNLIIAGPAHSPYQFSLKWE